MEIMEKKKIMEGLVLEMPLGHSYPLRPDLYQLGQPR